MSSVEVVKSSEDHLSLVPEMPFGDKSVLLSDNTYTVLCDGKPIAIGGIMPVWNGVGEAWAFFSSDFKKRPKLLLMLVKYYLDKVIKDCYLHRVQCMVLEGHKVGTRFVKKLGFEYEGTMRNYGQQCETFERWAKIV